MRHKATEENKFGSTGGIGKQWHLAAKGSKSLKQTHILASFLVALCIGLLYLALLAAPSAAKPTPTPPNPTATDSVG